jgi:23S rRNA (uridine2552-2'-O)-methyltransferase
LATDTAWQESNLMISDMAPNLSGIEGHRAARIAYGTGAVGCPSPEQTVVKLFHGSGYDPLVGLFRDTLGRSNAASNARPGPILLKLSGRTV